MTRIIPRDKIKHLEWNENNIMPINNTSSSPITNNFNPEVSIDRILNGETFYSEEKNSEGNYIGLPIALAQALEYATPKGYIATMPELIATKITADKTHKFWQNWYSVHTEENIGIDKKGLFYSKNDPVLVIVNGGGILTPDRIKKAYIDGLIGNSAKYDSEEFDDLLEGKLPDNNIVKLYSYEEIEKGVSNLPHKFGVVMPYSVAQATNSGYYKKDEFTKNPLVIARAGGIENLEKYYDLAKHSDGDLGCHHPFSGRDATIPQGRLLFLYVSYSVLNGINSLNGNGRFVGVAPEAHGTKK